MSRSILIEDISRGRGRRQRKSKTKKEKPDRRPQDLVRQARSWLEWLDGGQQERGQPCTMSIDPRPVTNRDDLSSTTSSRMPTVLYAAYSPPKCTIYAVALFRPSLMHPPGPSGRPHVCRTSHRNPHPHPSRGGIPLIGYHCCCLCLVSAKGQSLPNACLTPRGSLKKCQWSPPCPPASAAFLFSPQPSRSLG